MGYNQIPGDSASGKVPEQAKPFIEEAMRHLEVFDTKYAGKPYDWMGKHELEMTKVRLLTAAIFMNVSTLIDKVNERQSSYKREDGKSLDKTI